MRFGQLDYEIRQCEQHLDTTATRNTEVENYLVRYMLVRICAEYETRIAALVQRRCSRINDQYLLRFSHWGAKLATRNFNVGDISGMLGLFGEDYKKTFSDAVLKTEAETAWNNIYTNRHTVAHGNGTVMMTFPDLVRDYADSVVVIDKIVTALCLRPKDIKGLN